MTIKNTSTSESKTENIDSIDQALLTPIVRKALDRPKFNVLDWNIRKIHSGTGGGQFSSAVYHLKGKGQDQDQPVPWSLILKIFYPGDSADPSSPYYPKRESKAYRSGWLDNLPGGLAAPTCFEITDHANGETWLWLEELVDGFGESWPLARYGLAARHLGEFNGAYLVDQSLPVHSWISEDWLRRVVVESTPAIIQLSEELDHPLVRRNFPGDTGNRFLYLWAERERLLDALDQLPHTICHLDAFSRNLFIKQKSGIEETIVIDWAFVGYGALGEELEPLVCRSLGFADIDFSQALEIDWVVFSGYMDGLHEVGWKGNPKQVRLGYTSAVTLRLLVSYSQYIPFILDGSIQDIAPQILGIPYDETVDLCVACLRFRLDLADEALELLDTLG